MHHYGEDAVDVIVSGREFKIILTNHRTGAKITVSGPLKGIFEDPDQEMDQKSAEEIGRDIAHKFREVFVGIGVLSGRP
ncbi:MAG TPA: hypothetical protein VMT22_03775 [Terriglobales bacterium]|jgi:hypothetical protein|nr:hypothetical protein [Terriglobales bacterium]